MVEDDHVCYTCDHLICEEDPDQLGLFWLVCDLDYDRRVLDDSCINWKGGVIYEIP